MVFLLTQKYFPDPFNDSFKDGWGYSLSIIIISSVTKCIILHRIQYHVSRFEHQNILCILAETPFMVLRRYIMLRVDLYYRFFIYKNRQCLKIAFVIVGDCEE
jgi:hypothetical protein